MSDAVNYDGRTFRAATGRAGDDVPVAHYHQDGNLVWAEFAGGNVRRGSLTGVCAEDGTLELSYCMVLDDNAVVSGRCASKADRLPDGRIRVHEEWTRFTPGPDSGVSQLEEVAAGCVEPRARPRRRAR
jgi:hypothetical protein